MLPKFLRFKLYKKSLQSANFYKAWQAKLLINEINVKKNTIAKLSSQSKNFQTQFSNDFGPFDCVLIRKFLDSNLRKLEETITVTHEKKLNLLGVRQKIEPCDPEKVIFNYSDIVIPPRIKYLLAFGLDFGLPILKLDYIRYFLGFEKLASYVKNFPVTTNYNDVCQQLKFISHKYFYNFKSSKVFSIFTKNDIFELKKFARKDDIIVSRPDKGKGVVIINKSHYIAGISKILSNSDKFQQITDEIHRVSYLLEDKLNNFLLELKHLGHISTDLYKKLHVSGSGPGILYGLAKVHKENFFTEHLYRPIFAAYNCASYKISKYLVDILSPLAENQYTLKNSAQLTQEIDKITIHDKMFMASFDIKDLYTNIPLKETVEITMSLLPGQLLSLPQNLFRKLLELSIFNTMFAFNGKYYKQQDGLGMGLPLSPTLANIFLCFHETNWLENCPDDFKPVFYRRYMDDTLALFDDESQARRFLQYLNSQHSNMSFTMETEENRHIAFLDCLITRDEKKLNTSVYRKSTFTGLGLSFYSFCQFSFKINSIKTLLFRAKKVCSTFTALNKEISFLVNYFHANGYPKPLVYQQIKRFIQSMSHPSPKCDTVEKRKIFISLPYFGSQSEKLKLEVTNALGNYYPQLEINIVLSNPFTLGSLFRFKDQLPMALRSSIVYKYSCARCASGTYVGLTTRAVHMRIAEHRGRSFRTGKVLSQPVPSAIRDHSLKCSKQISSSDFTILGQEQPGSSLEILESLHIHCQRPNLNKNQTSFPLKIVI